MTDAMPTPFPRLETLRKAGADKKFLHLPRPVVAAMPERLTT
jgi:hypothetical protein